MLANTSEIGPLISGLRQCLDQGQYLRPALKVLFTILKLLVASFVSIRCWLYTGTRKCRLSRDLSRRIVVISVENSGVGIRAAQDLSALGATVILGVPEVEKITKFLTPHPRIDVRELDFCDLESVRSFAKKILKEQSRLDILINNFGRDREPILRITIDGFDETHQSISMGPFLLTQMLLPLMRESVPARVINTGFFNHARGLVDAPNFEMQVKGLCNGSGDAVCDAALALVMWTKALAKELRNSGVTVNLAHPGLAYTAHEWLRSIIGNRSSKWTRLFCGYSAVYGDDNLLYLCNDPLGESRNGSFFFNCQHQQDFNEVNRKTYEQFISTMRKLLEEAED